MNAQHTIHLGTDHAIPRGVWLAHWADDGDHTFFLLLLFGKIPAVPRDWLRGVHCHPLDAEDASSLLQWI
jgi:hypothetical protein